MGAVVKETGGEVEVEGPARLQGMVIEPGIPDAVSRDALLLAGMLAEGKTTLTDAVAGPDHAERLLHYYQVKTSRKGLTVSIWGGQVPESRDLHIPGDISYAAAFMAAAAAQPGSTLTVRGVGLNATRTAFLRVLVRMGAQVMEEISDARTGEAQGNVIVRGAPLKGTVIEAGEIDALRDELPALMMAASLASGSTVIQQTPATAERISRMTHNLRLMGVEVASLTEGAGIKGQDGKPLQPGLVNSSGDPCIAMAGAVAGFFTDGETIVEEVQCVESRWAGFSGDLERFQSREISEGHITPMLHVVARPGKPAKPARM
jgi:3-phosphoshikimate 1-carboxyvinyltransferase